MSNPVDQSGGFGGFAGFGLARAATHLSPQSGGVLFVWGRVTHPPNPETRRSSYCTHGVMLPV